MRHTLTLKLEYDGQGIDLVIPMGEVHIREGLKGGEYNGIPADVEIAQVLYITLLWALSDKVKFPEDSYPELLIMCRRLVDCFKE